MILVLVITIYIARFSGNYLIYETQNGKVISENMLVLVLHYVIHKTQLKLETYFRNT